VNWPQRLEYSKQLGSSFQASKPRPSSYTTKLSTQESTKASIPEVQISTNLKSELWFFHSGLGIFSGLTTNQKVLLLLLLVVVVVVVVLESGQSACAEGKEEIRQHIR
jgi:hypothetical protein